MVCFFVGNDFEERVRKPYEYSYVATLVNYLFNLRYVSDEAIGEAVKNRETPSTYIDDRPSFDLARFMEIEASRAEIYRKDNRTFGDAVYQSASTLVRMSRLCRSRRIDFVVVLAPDEVQVDELLQKRVVEAHGLTRRDFDFSLPNERLRRQLDEHDIESLDLLPVFVGGTNRQRLYKPNDTHWNIAGNRLAADALAEYFSKRFDRLTPARR